MKYNININQKSISDNGWIGKIYANHIAVLEAISTMRDRKGITKITDSHGEWWWISTKIIIPEIPMFEIKESRCKQIIVDLCEVGLLERNPDNEKYARMYLRMGENYHSYKYFKESEPHKEKETTYQDNNRLPINKMTGTYENIDRNNDINNNSINNHKEEVIVASDQVLELLPNPITQTKQASKGSAETQNSKLVLSAFDELLTKHEIKYTYPNSAALWRPIHSCCKQILSEVGAEGVADFFAKVDSMYKSHTFPFKDKSNLVLTFIGSAKIIPMILNYQASTPQNQIFQQPHPNTPEKPLYCIVNEWQGKKKWAKVWRWANKVAVLENDTERIEFNSLEVMQMSQYKEPIILR